MLTSVSIDLAGIAQIESLAPEGWEELITGTFARGRSALDQTSILQQAVPTSMLSSEALLQLLSSQLGLEEIPESSGEYDSADRTWALYETELQGFLVDIGLVEDGGYVYFVMLVSDAAEREELVTAVFQPIMDAITVP